MVWLLKMIQKHYIMEWTVRYLFSYWFLIMYPDGTHMQITRNKCIPRRKSRWEVTNQIACIWERAQKRIFANFVRTHKARIQTCGIKWCTHVVGQLLVRQEYTQLHKSILGGAQRRQKKAGRTSEQTNFPSEPEKQQSPVKTKMVKRSMWLCKCAARKGQPNVTPRMPTSSRSDALMLITYLALAISILMYTSWQSVFLISESCVLWRLAIRDEFGIFWVQWSNVDVTYSDFAFGAPSIAAAVTFAVTMLSMLQKTRERESQS